MEKTLKTTSIRATFVILRACVHPLITDGNISRFVVAPKRCLRLHCASLAVNDIIPLGPLQVCLGGANASIIRGSTPGSRWISSTTSMAWAWTSWVRLFLATSGQPCCRNLRGPIDLPRPKFLPPGASSMTGHASEGGRLLGRRLLSIRGKITIHISTRVTTSGVGYHHDEAGNKTVLEAGKKST